MTTQILSVGTEDFGTTFQLRGDMAVKLDIQPVGDFSVAFVIYEKADFNFSSLTCQFRQLDGTIDNSLKVKGSPLMCFELMYNKKLNIWDIGFNNINAVVTEGGGDGSAGGGGGGTSMTKEVLLVQDANHAITFDSSLGNHFRVVTNANVNFKNPVGYDSDTPIWVTVVQGLGAPYIASFGTQYAMQDKQPTQLATLPGAINLLKLVPTVDPDLGILWIVECTPDKAYTAGYGAVTELAQIDQGTKYYQMGVPLGSSLPGAMFQLQDGQTLYILRDGRGPESTGTIPSTDPANVNNVYKIIGKPQANGTDDHRPTLTLLHENRPSYNKALINLEGYGTTILKDFKISGARNSDNDARGVCPNGLGMNLDMYNMEIHDCNNGILSGNQGYTGIIRMFDCLIDKCGIGGPTSDPTHGYSTVGYTHSTYFGHADSTVELYRCSYTNSINGDNVKCRTGKLKMRQVLCKGAVEGRELEFPNGGVLDCADSIIWKSITDGGTGNTAETGANGMDPDTQEGTDTSRPRSYLFTNVLFQCDIPSIGRDVTFLLHLDRTVGVQFVDTQFVGQGAMDTNGDHPAGSGGDNLILNTHCVNGVRWWMTAPAPIYTFTGGPVGPRLPVGYVMQPMELES